MARWEKNRSGHVLSLSWTAGTYGFPVAQWNHTWWDGFRRAWYVSSGVWGWNQTRPVQSWYLLLAFKILKANACWGSLWWQGEEREELSDYPSTSWRSKYPVGQVGATGDVGGLFPHPVSPGWQVAGSRGERNHPGQRTRRVPQNSGMHPWQNQHSSVCLPREQRSYYLRNFPFFLLILPVTIFLLLLL